MKQMIKKKRVFFGILLLLLPLLTSPIQTNAQSWEELIPNGTSPIGRHSFSAVFDFETNQMIIFGGRNDFVGPVYNDIWRLTNANGLGASSWTSIVPDGSPPQQRWQHKAVYDQANDRMIVFGGAAGSSSPCLNDVWVLINASGQHGTPSWQRLFPSSGSPGVRFAFSAVYDPITNSLIIYGGSNCFSAGTYNDVWLLSNANGLGGTPIWTNLNPSGTGPSLNRDSHEAVYDIATNRMITFGGRSITPVYMALVNDVWVLSNANGTGGTPAWTKLTPSGTPPSARQGCAGIFDSINNRMVIFGGSSAIGQNNDVWELSLGGTPRWNQLNPSGGPPTIRAAHQAVFDQANNRMVIFGGHYFDSGIIILNDVWVLNLSDEIADDTTAPVITTPADITAEATSPAGAVVTFSVTAEDNIDGIVAVTSTPASDSTFPLGDTIVTCKASDTTGNETTETFMVSVVDTTPPTITAPANVTAEATGPLTSVDLGVPSVSDLADPNPAYTNNAPADGFPVGTTTVTWTATDASGYSAAATQQVIVQDTTPPTITAPANVTAEATGPLTSVDLGVPAVSDLTDPNPVYTNNTPADGFPVGTTEVTWTVTDASGNQATDIQLVTIQASPPALVAILIANVEFIIDEAGLNKGEGNSLTSKLETALRAIDRGRNNTAVNQLQAFINQVNALLRSGRLSGGQAGILTTAANDIISRL